MSTSIDNDPGSVEALPVLPSLDFDETVKFYCEKLGFSDPPAHRETTYLILKRGNMELHFWRAEDARLCRNSSVYIRGSGVDALYDEFAKCAIDTLSPFIAHPWQMKEFQVHDPHGNLLRFGRSADRD